MKKKSTINRDTTNEVLNANLRAMVNYYKSNRTWRYGFSDGSLISVYDDFSIAIGSLRFHNGRLLYTGHLGTARGVELSATELFNCYPQTPTIENIKSCIIEGLFGSAIERELYFNCITDYLSPELAPVSAESKQVNAAI